MKRLLNRSLAAAVAIVGLNACTPDQESGGAAPGSNSPVLPSHQSLSASQKTTPKRMEVTSMLTSDDDGNTMWCTAWVTDLQRYDAQTGEFEYRYSCPEGGDIATIVTLGQGDQAGNGRYTTTYAMRDGSTVVWSYVYTTDQEGVAHYTGSSSDGSSFVGAYRYVSAERNEAHEEYTMAAGIYVNDGVYDGNGFFTGTSTFDNPDTAENPDYTLRQSKEEDGTMLQVYSSSMNGWAVAYTTRYHVDGSMDYQFTYNQLSTAVSPDFEGTYQYAADGAGSGGYTQLFDNGSRLEVQHVIAADGSYTETWVYRDATTDIDVDQEGAMQFLADKTGSGTVTTHNQDGSTQVCDVHVSADGVSTVDNCR